MHLSYLIFITLYQVISDYCSGFFAINLSVLIVYSAPFAFFLLFALCMPSLIKAAKNQKVLAFALGSLIQMVIPDPYAERTIKIVAEQKQQKTKKEKEKQFKGLKISK